MADTTTTHYAFTMPEPGASFGSWGTKLNTDLVAIDTAIFNAQEDATEALADAATAQAAADAAQADATQGIADAAAAQADATTALANAASAQSTAEDAADDASEALDMAISGIESAEFDEGVPRLVIHTLGGTYAIAASPI